MSAFSGVPIDVDYSLVDERKLDYDLVLLAENGLLESMKNNQVNGSYVMIREKEIRTTSPDRIFWAPADIFNLSYSEDRVLLFVESQQDILAYAYIEIKEVENSRFHATLLLQEVFDSSSPCFSLSPAEKKEYIWSTIIDYR